MDASPTNEKESKAGHFPKETHLSPSLSDEFHWVSGRPCPSRGALPHGDRTPPGPAADCGHRSRGVQELGGGFFLYTPPPICRFPQPWGGSEGARSAPACTWVNPNSRLLSAHLSRCGSGTNRHGPWLLTSVVLLPIRAGFLQPPFWPLPGSTSVSPMSARVRVLC